MKAYLLSTLLVSAFVAKSVYAVDWMMVEGGHVPGLGFTVTYDPTIDNDRDKDAKIVYLNKMLEQQQKLYEEKVSYLEYELKKSKERLVEKSINQEKTQDIMLTRFNEETAYLKRELVAKTKTMLEYQRQLEKIKPSEDMKNLIKVNTELALELRKSADQMAIMQLKWDQNKNGVSPVFGGGGGRMPASTDK